MKTMFENSNDRHRSGRYLALVLRELLPELGIYVDEFGYAALCEVLPVMQNMDSKLTMEHIEEIVKKDPQRRFDVKGDKIRAKAGHRYPVKVPWTHVAPPEFLYHGTSADVLSEILTKGILRMGKAYVHLASTVERAWIIGLRKTDSPKLIRIKSGEAHNAGIRFWRSGQISPDGEIFLSDEIPAVFLEEFAKPVS